MEQLFKDITSWYMAHINYGTVILFMTMESTFIPFPSEVIVPPAAWKAAQGELNVYIVTLCGVAGSIFGALINYFLSLWIGRKMVYALADTKIANMMFIDKNAVEKAEQFFIKYGKSSTFIGRLIPGIRHLISIPAGLSKMNIKDFILYTALGSGIWNIILACLGYFLYSKKELLNMYFHEIVLGCFGLGVLFLIYIIYRFNKKLKTDHL